jgi:hypothetical protein
VGVSSKKVRRECLLHSVSLMHMRCTAVVVVVKDYLVIIRDPRNLQHEKHSNGN